MKMKYPKDLTGVRFEKLVAVYPNGKTKQGAIIWHCKCDCGGEKDVSRNSLISGNTKSCGCINTTFSRKDLKGLVIDNITVLYDLPQKGSARGVMWHCKCVCGGEVDYPSDYLSKHIEKKIQKKLTCGKCNAYLPPIKRGMLTPILGQTIILNGKKYGPYKCDCGNECMAIIKDVNYGSKKSCGCLQHLAPEGQDLTGKRFGMLVVHHKMPRGTKKKVTSWYCECDCGGSKVVSTGNLNSGNTKHCGCLTFNDLTGKKFGRWTVLYKNTSKKTRYVYYRCRCDCGTEKDVVGASLKSGASTSCGCFHSENHKLNMNGKKFGLLSVIEETQERDKDGSIMWKCLCECGTTTLVSASSLSSGKIKSCGCLVSLGEHTVKKILEDNNIPFVTQKTFDGCRFPDTNTMARFDFWINNKYIAEFDGSQHFEETYLQNKVDHKWQGYEYVKAHDNVKTDFCKSNNIPLIRIPYKRLSKLSVDDILLDTTRFRVV